MHPVHSLLEGTPEFQAASKQEATITIERTTDAIGGYHQASSEPGTIWCHENCLALAGTRTEANCQK
jgi:hypothetical protein